MFKYLWARFSRKKNVQERRIADLQDMEDIYFSDDDEKTEMIDTLSYHQYSRETLSDKALRLANGAKQ